MRPAARRTLFMARARLCPKIAHDCAEGRGEACAIPKRRALQQPGQGAAQDGQRGNVGGLAAGKRDIIGGVFGDPAVQADGTKVHGRMARAETPADAQRRGTVLDKYRQGQLTSSARDDQATGTVSKAVN